MRGVCELTGWISSPSWPPDAELGASACLLVLPHSEPLYSKGVVLGVAGRGGDLKGTHVREGWGATQGDRVPETTLLISRAVPAQIAECVSPLYTLSCIQSGRSTSFMPSQEPGSVR